MLLHLLTVKFFKLKKVLNFNKFVVFIFSYDCSFVSSVRSIKNFDKYLDVVIHFINRITKLRNYETLNNSEIVT